MTNFKLIRSEVQSSLICSASLSFGYNHYCILLEPKPTPSLVVEIISALDLKKMDADLLLRACLDVANDVKHLIIIALSLRYGANPNLYIELSDKDSLKNSAKELHIL